jgi:hypothetical protein
VMRQYVIAYAVIMAVIYVMFFELHASLMK